ncbi:hypothetical protein [Nonomuraea maritima]|uniref:hypothetical protein n=1 Tax=Nonomuraea maritima TaxID=683260 RepID=UPI00371CF38C
MPPVAVVPSVAAEPVVAPRADDGRRPARPLKDRPPVPRPQGSPEPPSVRERPRDAERRTVQERPARDERRAVRPRTLPRRGLPDPCATFHDFRRGACHAFLERLTR